VVEQVEKGIEYQHQETARTKVEEQIGGPNDPGNELFSSDARTAPHATYIKNAGNHVFEKSNSHKLKSKGTSQHGVANGTSKKSKTP